MRTPQLSRSRVSPRFAYTTFGHTWATRAAEAGVDVGTLAPLLGHSKLVMVLRYVHPGESHCIDAVKKLAIASAARQIAEFEKKKTPQESPATISATAPENSAIFEGSKTEGKFQADQAKRRRSDSNRCIKVLQTTEPGPVGVLTELNGLQRVSVAQRRW